jgi:hypothetical protein
MPGMPRAFRQTCDGAESSPGNQRRTEKMKYMLMMNTMRAGKGVPRGPRKISRRTSHLTIGLNQELCQSGEFVSAEALLWLRQHGHNCGDLRSFQPFRTTGAPSPSASTALKSAVEKGLSTAGPMLLCSSGKARLRVKTFEMARKIKIERFSLITSKQFDEVTAGVNAAIGPSVIRIWLNLGDQLTKSALFCRTQKRR